MQSKGQNKGHEIMFVSINIIGPFRLLFNYLLSYFIVNAHALAADYLYDDISNWPLHLWENG